MAIKKYNVRRDPKATPIDLAIQYYGNSNELLNLLKDLDMTYDELASSTKLTITPKDNKNVNYFVNNNETLSTYSTPLSVHPLTKSDVRFVGLYNPISYPCIISGATADGRHLTGVSYLTLKNYGTTPTTYIKYAVSIEFKDSNPGSNGYYSTNVDNNVLENLNGLEEKTYKLQYYPGSGGFDNMVLLNRHNIYFDVYTGVTASTKIFRQYKNQTFDIAIKPTLTATTNLTSFTGTTQSHTTTVDMGHPYGNVYIDYLKMVQNYYWVGYYYDWSNTNLSTDPFVFSDPGFFNIKEIATVTNVSAYTSNSIQTYVKNTVNEPVTIGKQLRLNINVKNIKVSPSNVINVWLDYGGGDISTVYNITTTGVSSYNLTSIGIQGTFDIVIYADFSDSIIGGYDGFDIDFSVNKKSTTPLSQTGSLSSITYYTLQPSAANRKVFTLPMTTLSAMTYGNCIVTTSAYDRNPFELPGQVFENNFSWNF